MAAQRLRRIGNSVGVLIPARELHAAGMDEGSRVQILPGGPGELRLVLVEKSDDELTQAQVEAGLAFAKRFHEAFKILASS